MMHEPPNDVMQPADFHTHILPGIDDGSPDVETSLAMLQKEKEQSVDRVVLTPHFYARHDDPDRFLTARDRAVAELRSASEGKPLPMLHVGAEVAYFRGMSECDILKELCIEGTRCILVELPATQWDGQILRELEELRSKQGLIPVVAHVDRYLQPFAARQIMSRLLERSVLLQANSSFFLHRRTFPMALRLLRRGQIHLLGSDCHDLTERVPNLGQATAVIRRALGEDALRPICILERELFPGPV